MIAAILMVGCGSSGSSGQAQSLLKQTFSGPHTVKSGVLNFSIALAPTGSSTVKTPIDFGLSGPFQSRGSGTLPESNFTLSVDALGHHGELGIVSTGTHGYITLQGTAYQLPAADFQKLATSFAGAAGGSGTGGLSKLGINPLHWLKDPTVVGTENVAGASTTHIRARVNVAALLSDLNTFLERQANGGAAAGKLPTGIPPTTQQSIAKTVKKATVDVWTGTSDKTLRKLAVELNFPVSGQYSTLFGGLTSAAIGLNLQYANLNQPQTITAPGSVQPFGGFATKFAQVLQQIKSTLGISSTGATGTGTGTGSGTTTGSGATSSNIGPYTTCLHKAGNDVTKMQKCAALLNSSGG